MVFFFEQALVEIPILVDGLHYQLVVGNASCPFADSLSNTQRVETEVGGVILSYNNTITALTLPFHNLKGTLPPSLGQLSNLLILDLSENFLIGSIPESVYSNLTDLQFLHLGVNKLTGSLSNNISQWKSMTTLILLNNQLEGTIPSAIGELTNLHRLQLDLNHFIGTLPTAICDVYSLQTLTLAGNRYLFGTLPQCLYSSFPNIFEFNIRANHFSGTISPSIGLWNQTLHILDISANNFQESPPKTFQAMHRLLFLIMAFNSFTGPLHHWLPCGTQPVAMTFFHVGSNYFSGPNANCTWPYLTHYLTYSNLLTGEFPSKLISQANFFRGINIATNYLTGSIPAQTFANTPNFDNFLLFRNQLTGSFFKNVAFPSIPETFGIVNYFN
jgi:hypothetical protein